MNYFGMKLMMLSLLITPLHAHAGGDEVVIVYNSSQPGSKAVAEHYAKMRQVPTGQIYGMTLSTNEEISRAEFRDSLQVPLAIKMDADGLWKFGPVKLHATNGAPERVVTEIVTTKIRYTVLCYGVPLK